MIRISICFIYLKIRVLKDGSFWIFVKNSYPKAKFFLMFIVTFIISYFVTHQYKEKLHIQVLVGGGKKDIAICILKAFKI